ncbi:hypothetical protein Tco_1333479 [Tanacetum coccineum]
MSRGGGDEDKKPNTGDQEFRFVRVRVGVGSHSRFCSNWSASGLFQVQGLICGLGLLYKVQVHGRLFYSLAGPSHSF